MPILQGHMLKNWWMFLGMASLIHIVMSLSTGIQSYTCYMLLQKKLLPFQLVKMLTWLFAPSLYTHAHMHSHTFSTPCSYMISWISIPYLWIMFWETPTCPSNFEFCCLHSTNQCPCVLLTGMTSRSRGIRICTCNNYFEGPERPIKMFDFSGMNCETCSFVRLVAYLYLVLLLSFVSYGNSY